MITDLAVRFLIGGVLVTLFSLLGDVLRPKSFAGLFSAAPSIALATLSLSFGDSSAPVQARSMILGAIGLCVYCGAVRSLLMHRQRPTHVLTLLTLPLWFGVSFLLWGLVLR